MPKKPIDTLTWKKNDKYIKIDKFYHQIIIINRDTGKTEVSIEEVSEMPPITRKRKPKHK